jgi:hypothetical protein
LDDPAKNTAEYLTQRIHELDKLTADDLQKALDRIEEAREIEDKEMMEKYHVQKESD